MDKTESGILARLKAEIPAKYDKTTGSYVHDVLAGPAIEFETAYGELDRTALRAFAATAEGSDLDAVLEQYGFVRKAATYAAGEVTVRGAADAQITAGSLVAAGRTVYEVLDTAALTDGTAVVRIRAQTPGSAGNAAAGAVNYFPVTLPKITSVTNETAITGGTDAESDAEYRERYTYFLEHPVTSGNKYEYEQWAREVDGVGLAKCYPIWAGPGTVKVVITTAEMEPAGTDLIAAVKAYIETRRPVGADLTVESAGRLEISVSAAVTLEAGYGLDSIKTQYMSALDGYFKDVGFAGGLIPYTKIGSLLQEIPGVRYYSNLTVNGGTANVTVDDGELAVLGGVTLA